MLKHLISLTLCCLLPLCAIAAPAKVEQINVVSEVWANATEQSGRGLYWDILRLVYEKENISLSFESMPYARSVMKVKNGEADAWIGASLNEVPDAIYPQYPLDKDHYYALYLTGKVSEWQGQKSLENKRVGWVRGYELDQHLQVKVEYKEFIKLKVGLNRLKAGKLDFILDAKYDLEQAMIAFGKDSSQYQMQKIIELPIYLGFANNDRGRYLAKVYDQRLAELIASGEIRTLFDKHQWPSYPFED
jgi:polar amino acid transport system substrate-binding protein